MRSPEPRLTLYVTRLSRVAAMLVALGGAAVLLGWWLHLAALKSILPQLVSMKPNTALCFVLLGCALWLLNGPAGGRGRQLLVWALAGGVLLITGWTLLEYLWPLDGGLDQWLFADDTRVTPSSQPGRMAPAIAVALGLGGLAVGCIERHPVAARRMSGLALLLGAWGVSGYLFGAASLYSVVFYSSIALHTAVLLVLFNLGLMVARPAQGDLALLLEATLGGTSARSLTLAIPGALVAASALIWLGLRLQFFDARFGLALGVVVWLLLSVLIGMRVARALHAADAAKDQAQAALRELNHHLEQTVRERTAALEQSNGRLRAEMTERHLSEQALRTALDLLEYSQAASKVGGWELDLATDHLYWTAETYRIFETTPEAYQPTLDASLGYFLPESRQRITQALQDAMEQGLGYALELEALTALGQHIDLYTTCTASMANGKPAKLTGIFQDITQSKSIQRSLQASNTELERSNADLEQFAYVASHDLQEPLRAISSSVQLLKRRYGGTLDARADEFISHAVGGAQRMQAVIDDLLAYGRISAAPKVVTTIDLNAALQVAQANLAQAIDSSQATIHHDELPHLMANPIQIAQLFQNLIANALKFCGDKPAQVYVGARQEGPVWVFSVADQGIGIEPQYFERIFKLFQRLHTRTEYAGTGIGLTVCQKIVERHGGRIWVESIPGVGSTFYFTLPVDKIFME